VAGRRRLLFGLALAAFVFHFVAFIPLHLSHAYYQYAMAQFLVAALGLSAVALHEAGGRRRHLAWLIVGLLGVACGHVYLAKTLPIQRHDANRGWFTRLAAALAERTRPSDVVVGFNLD
jgi:4-amino-4-deoxy-L-arabinose transferase-like glycosyltransferase